MGYRCIGRLAQLNARTIDGDQLRALPPILNVQLVRPKTFTLQTVIRPRLASSSKFFPGRIRVENAHSTTNS